MGYCLRVKLFDARSQQPLFSKRQTARILDESGVPCCVEGMTEKPVNSTPKRRSRAEVSRLVEEYLKSGLSLKAFCRQHNLDRSTLARRLRQRQSSTAHNPSSPGWVRVELVSEPDPVSVGVPSGVTLVAAGGRRIELARNFDATILHQLLGLPESH